MVGKILIGFHTVMMEPTKPFDFSDDHDMKKASELSILLNETMLSAPGVGLAANQIGIPLRVFAFCDFESEWNHSDTIISETAYNATITGYSKDTIELEEGCLSFPGLIAVVNRPVSIKLSYQDYTGTKHDTLFTGMNARIIQHEIDHLDGVLYFNRVPRIKREKLLMKWRKENGMV